MVDSNNKISQLVTGQAPFFVRTEHGKFIQFLKAYYDYLDQYYPNLSDGKTSERLKHILEYADIDSTLDDFTELFYERFIKNFPNESSLADTKLVMKHAKDLFRAKGTEKATRFLMRAIFNVDIEFYYPKRDVLRASDGKWYIKKTLRVTNTKIDDVANTDITGLEKYIGYRIRGSVSNATAIIESVDRFYDAGTVIDEIELTGIGGTFQNGENISATYIEAGNSHVITSEVFGATINSINITNPGSGYLVGDPVIIESSTGNGASAIVGRVSTGNVSAIIVEEGGAGYRVNDSILITGGGGSGAAANVGSVTADSNVHPNTYNIIYSIVALEANTPVNNTIYSNLNSSIIDPANSANIATVTSSFVYGNTGPVRTVSLITSGSNYTSVPDISVIANTRITELGILGRMVINNGGTGYAANDLIRFIHGPLCYGSGANAQVKQVDANGTILAVQFTANGGYPVGGMGYDRSYLPTTSIVSSNGTGANIAVTQLLGTGGTFSIANTTLGAIERIIVLDRGSNYLTSPQINLTASGDGTAQAISTLILGSVTYPGRYLNDDGHLSSFNFLQDRDYYQNYSYVIRSARSIGEYRKVIKDIVHPAGMKLFGEYLYTENASNKNVTTSVLDSKKTKIKSGVYSSTYGNVRVGMASHGLSTGNTISLEFTTGNVTANTLDTANISNGIFAVSNVINSNYFIVNHFLSVANTSGNVKIGINI